MLLLSSTSDKVQVVTDASADVEVHASWIDNASGAITPGRTNTASITSATTTDVVASPASSTHRNVKNLTMRNAHASTATNVTVQHTDGTNVETMMKVNLLAGETLVMDQNGAWHHHAVTGGEYLGFPFAAQADQEAAASTILAVTPGTQQFHPSAAKFWCKAGVTGVADASFNVSSITDGGTGLMTVNIGTDFSSANYCYVYGIENLDASIDAAADGFYAMLGLAGQAAGTLAMIAKAEAGTIAADPTKWSVAGFGDQ